VLFRRSLTGEAQAHPSHGGPLQDGRALTSPFAPSCGLDETGDAWTV
jgi:hypothetical protein